MASASNDYSGVAHFGTIICEKCNFQHVYQMDSPPNLRLLHQKTPNQVSVTRRFKINICSKCMGGYGTNYFMQNLQNLRGMFVRQYMEYQENLNNPEKNMTKSSVPVITRPTDPTDEEKRKLLLKNSPLPEYQGRKIFITNNNVFVRENRPLVINRSQTPSQPVIVDSDEDEENEEEEESDNVDFDFNDGDFDDDDLNNDEEEEVDIM